MISRIRGYLQYGRIHSMPITFTMIVSAWYLTFGYINWYVIILTMTLSLGFHYVAFGFNSFFDYHHDKLDRHKHHFDYFSFLDNKKYVNVLIVILLIVTMVILYYSYNKYISIISILLMFIFGNLYNMYSKEKGYAPLFSGLSSAFIFTMFGKINIEIITIAIIMFFANTFRDGYSGNLKDRDMCFAVENKLWFVYIFLLYTVMAGIVFKFSSGINFGAALFFATIELVENMNLVKIGTNKHLYDRDHVINISVSREIANKFFLVSLVLPIETAIIVMTISLVWLVSMNKLLWGGVDTRV